MKVQPLNDIIQNNLREVESTIAAACERVGRDASDITLVAVTKYADLAWVETLANIHPTFGENRPQQLAERRPKFPDAEWHLIGQLQRNKARLAVENAAWIHSVDSLRLLERIAAVARELQKRPRILLQVNVSGEESKSGFRPDELTAGWERIVTFQSDLEISGMMTMAPASEDPEAARPTFRGLAELRTRLAEDNRTRSAGIELCELSMGMSGDFEVAIEEGATVVRVGSRLYRGLAD